MQQLSHTSGTLVTSCDESEAFVTRVRVRVWCCSVSHVLSALMSVYRALLSVYRALCRVYRAL